MTFNFKPMCSFSDSLKCFAIYAPILKLLILRVATMEKLLSLRQKSLLEGLVDIGDNPSAIDDAKRQNIILRALRQSRANPRQRVLKKAAIEFNGETGAVSINCTVWNISKTGACLSVISSPGIPDFFDLVMPSDYSRRACRVVWRKLKKNRTSIWLGVRTPQQ